MSLTWERDWVEVVVEYRGSRIKAYRDRSSGLLACPICGLQDRASYFFSVDDLFNHIIAHVEERWRSEQEEMVEPEESEGVGREEEEEV